MSSTSREIPRGEVVVVAKPPGTEEEDVVAMNISENNIPPGLRFSVAVETEGAADDYEDLTLDSDGEQERRVMYVPTEEDTEKAKQSIDEIIRSPPRPPAIPPNRPVIIQPNTSTGARYPPRVRDLRDRISSHLSGTPKEQDQGGRTN